MKKNNNIKKIIVPTEDRRRCIVEGCDGRGHHTGIYRKDGTPIFRKRCNFHHSKKTAHPHGLTSMDEVLAKQKGYETVAEYKNSTHPSRYVRKDYCENIDGRLGFVCTTNLYWPGMLDVDHVNGDSSNNSLDNLQTLCKCCHAYKTWKNRDWETPGRKAIREASEKKPPVLENLHTYQRNLSLFEEE